MLPPPPVVVVVGVGGRLVEDDDDVTEVLVGEADEVEGCVVVDEVENVAEVTVVVEETAP